MSLVDWLVRSVPSVMGSILSYFDNQPLWIILSVGVLIFLSISVAIYLYALARDIWPAREKGSSDDTVEVRSVLHGTVSDDATLDNVIAIGFDRLATLTRSQGFTGKNIFITSELERKDKKDG